MDLSNLCKLSADEILKGSFGKFDISGDLNGFIKFMQIIC